MGFDDRIGKSKLWAELFGVPEIPLAGNSESEGDNLRIKITAVPSWFGKYAPVLRHLIGKDVPVADEPTTDRGVPVLAAEIARLLYDSEAALTAWRGWKINQPGRILYVPHDCCELIHEPENVDRE